MTNNTNLTNQEYKVLYYLSHEMNSKEIGCQLHVSHHTVITYRRRLLSKLQAKNTAGLIRKGFEKGILSISQIQST